MEWVLYVYLGGLFREMSSKGLLGWRFAQILSIILNKTGMFPLRYISPLFVSLVVTSLHISLEGFIFLIHYLYGKWYI